MWTDGIPTLGQLAEYVEFLDTWERKNMTSAAGAALAYHEDLSYANDSLKDQFIGAFKTIEALGWHLIEEHREHCIPCDLYEFFDFEAYAKDQDIIIEKGSDKLWYAFHG